VLLALLVCWLLPDAFTSQIPSGDASPAGAASTCGKLISWHLPGR